MAGCADVCIDHWYDEYNEFFIQRVQAARKSRRCVECARSISPGDRYEYSFGKSEGVTWTQSTCLTCRDIRESFVCGSFVFGMLWESIFESIFPRWEEEGPWDCLAKLETQEARDYIQERYESWKEE